MMTRYQQAKWGTELGPIGRSRGRTVLGDVAARWAERKVRVI